MLKKFYVFAWILLAGSAIVSFFNGTFDELAMIGVSLGTVSLVYAFALWAVTRDSQLTA